MERGEAAEFLGVSLSTLDRIASQGRLTRGRAKKKTKPITVFDLDELTRLKEELQTSRPKEVFRRLNTEKPQDAVGFRLDPFYVLRLKEEGGKRGLSAGEFARKLVVQGLEDDREDRVIREFSALRENLAKMFYLLMVTKLGATEDEANEILETLVGAA